MSSDRICLYINLTIFYLINMRYLSEKKHELLKCVGTLLAKQERKYKGKRIIILGYDEGKRAIVAKSWDNEIIFIRSIAELRSLL